MAESALLRALLWWTQQGILEEPRFTASMKRALSSCVARHCMKSVPALLLARKSIDARFGMSFTKRNAESKKRCASQKVANKDSHALASFFNIAVSKLFSTMEQVVCSSQVLMRQDSSDSAVSMASELSTKRT